MVVAPVLFLLILLATNGYLLYHMRQLLIKGESSSFLVNRWFKKRLRQSTNVSSNRKKSTQSVYEDVVPKPNVTEASDTCNKNNEINFKLKDLAEKKSNFRSERQSNCSVYDDVRGHCESNACTRAGEEEILSYDKFQCLPAVFINPNMKPPQKENGCEAYSELAKGKPTDSQLYQKLNLNTREKPFVKPKPKINPNKAVETSFSHKNQQHGCRENKRKPPTTYKSSKDENSSGYVNIPPISPRHQFSFPNNLKKDCV